MGQAKNSPSTLSVYKPHLVLGISSLLLAGLIVYLYYHDPTNRPDFDSRLRSALIQVESPLKTQLVSSLIRLHELEDEGKPALSDTLILNSIQALRDNPPQFPEIIGVAVSRQASFHNNSLDVFAVAGVAHAPVDYTDSARINTGELEPYLAPIMWSGDTVLTSSISGRRGLRAVHWGLESTSVDDTISTDSEVLTLLFFDPIKGFEWQLANTAYLIIMLFFLKAVLASASNTTKTESWSRALRLFRWALILMLTRYGLRHISVLIGMIQGPFAAFTFKSYIDMFGLLLPDAPLVIMSAIYMMRDDSNPPSRLFTLLNFAVYYAVITPEFFQAFKLASLSISSVFVPENKTVDILQRLHAFFALMLLAFGLLERARARLQQQDDPPGAFQRNVAWIPPISFAGYAIAQLLFFNPAFFAYVFIMKGLALSALAFDSHTERALRDYQVDAEEDEKRRREIRIKVAERSLDIVLALDGQQRIQWYSRKASSLLGIDGPGEKLGTWVANHCDEAWIVRRLILPGIARSNFEIAFKTPAGKRLTCLCDFVPRTAGFDTDIIFARPIEDVAMIEFKRRFYVHGLQGTITACKSWFQQFTDFIRENRADALLAHESVGGLRKSLDFLSEEIKGPSDATIDIQGPAYCDLAMVLSSIRDEARSGAMWSGMTLHLPTSLEPTIVRAREGTLRMILDELINNAHREIIKQGNESKRELTIEVLGQERGFRRTSGLDPQQVTILVRNSGPPIEDSWIMTLRDTSDVLPFDSKGGLQKIKFYCLLFGGEFTIGNRPMEVGGELVDCPTFEIVLWRAVEGDSDVE